MSTIDRAVIIAIEAHTGQLDRYDQPYILHPLRVMARVETPTEKIVAVMHDVIEDSDRTLEDLRQEGFSEEIVTALALLTKGTDEAYTDYVSRLAHNGLARRVKLADLEDNMDLRRVPALTESDAKRIQRYHWAWLFLKEVR